MAKVIVEGKTYYRNQDGNLISEEQIKPQDLVRDSLVQSLVTQYLLCRDHVKRVKAQMEKELGSASDSDILTARLALLEEEIMLLTERMSLFQNCYTLYYLTGLDPDRLPMITDGMVNDSIAE